MMRYFILIYAVSSLIFGACAATSSTATAVPIAQSIVPTSTSPLPTPTSTPSLTPSPTLTPTATPLPTWQLLTEPGSSFARVAAVPSGEVWAVGADGLFRFDDEVLPAGVPTERVGKTGVAAQTWQTFPLPDSLREQNLTDQLGPQYYLTDLAVVPNGTVWLGTFQDGLYRFEGGSWTHYTTTEGLIDNVIVGLAVDPQNNLWV